MYLKNLLMPLRLLTNIQFLMVAVWIYFYMQITYFFFFTNVVRILGLKREGESLCLAIQKCMGDQISSVNKFLWNVCMMLFSCRFVTGYSSMYYFLIESILSHLKAYNRASVLRKNGTEELFFKVYSIYLYSQRS